ncbi:hypothetical protein RHS01_09529 [Rhizoctonia solani]|uniref:Uncharacterized protein n=1 Tax=Rhizoctonia solani TaxID=456999 RepID=A0A8H7M3E3_9AGAM|nr:hypothetical protein RHS01_09529 [Rhizoctonia solani]
MSAEPTSRLSKRESSTTLRRDTLATSGRKRSGSNASTTSKASLMFASPAKGFGLVRKANRNSFVAPVSVTGGLDHSLNPSPAHPPVDSAEESLRGVQARAPIQLAPLSESPKNVPTPLPDDSAPVSVSASPTSSTRTPRPKSRTSMIPVFVGSPERTRTTSSNLSNTASAKPMPSPPRSASPRQVSRSATISVPTKASANRAQPPSTSSRQAASKFRAPTMSPSSSLTRKASTSSIRSASNGFKPTYLHLSQLDLAGSSCTPKLDTGSVSAKIAATDPSQPSPSSTSWLSSISGIKGNKASTIQPIPDIASSPVEVSSSLVDNKASNSGTMPTSATSKPEDQSPVSPTDTDNEDFLAAQHASSWTNTPASWLAWISSAPGLSTSPQSTSPIAQGSEVMDIGSDEDEVLTEDNGRTPVMTPGVYDGQRMWGWGGKVHMSEESRMRRNAKADWGR